MSVSVPSSSPLSPIQLHFSGGCGDLLDDHFKGVPFELSFMAVIVLYADNFPIRPKTSKQPSDSLNESAVKCN